MRITLAIAALLIGCVPQPTTNMERLEVAPIPGLAGYQGGKVFRPFRYDFEDADRYPMPAPGKASDPQCWLGDTYFADCLIYECDAALACPTGWVCRDVRFAFDPPQDAPTDESYLRHKWPSYHLASCVSP